MDKTTKDLKQLSLDSGKGHFLNLDNMFVGRQTQQIMRASHKDDTVVAQFKKKAATGFIQCAKHMQKRLPLNNKVLRSMSAIDPLARGHSETKKALDKLAEFAGPFLSDEEKESLPLETHRYQVDTGLKSYSEGDRIDVWWSGVIQQGKYPALSRLALVCLSCFHGPMVESSFNTMGDIINIRSTRMKVETFSAIQTVKYGLKSRNTTALSLFKKKRHQT